MHCIPEVGMKEGHISCLLFVCCCPSCPGHHLPTDLISPYTGFIDPLLLGPRARRGWSVEGVEAQSHLSLNDCFSEQSARVMRVEGRSEYHSLCLH